MTTATADQLREVALEQMVNSYKPVTGAAADELAEMIVAEAQSKTPEWLDSMNVHPANAEMIIHHIIGRLEHEANGPRCHHTMGALSLRWQDVQIELGNRMARVGRMRESS